MTTLPKINPDTAAERNRSWSWPDLLAAACLFGLAVAVLSLAIAQA